MIPVVNCVHFNLAVKLISTLIVLIPLITCNPIAIDPQGASNATTNNQSISVLYEKGQVLNGTGLPVSSALKMILGTLPNYRSQHEPVMKIFNETDFKVMVIERVFVFGNHRQDSGKGEVNSTITVPSTNQNSSVTRVTTPPTEPTVTSKPGPYLTDVPSPRNSAQPMVPETPRNHEGAKMLNQSSSNKDDQTNFRQNIPSNQTETPTANINISVLRQIEKLLTSANQREVQPQPVQSPVPKVPLPSIPPTYYPGQFNPNPNRNQNNENTILTRSQYPNNVNRNQYIVRREYKPSPHHEPGQPYAIEEIVHSQGLRANQRGKDEMDPELTVKIIRAYYPDSLIPSETRQTFIRQPPQMVPGTSISLKSQGSGVPHYYNNQKV